MERIMKSKLIDLFKDKPYLILIVLYLIFTPIFLTPWVHGNDGAGYFSYTRSLVIDHDLDLKNEKAHFIEDFSVNSIKEDSNTGVYFSQYPIGTALAWTPFYLMGHLGAKMFNYSQDGYSLPYVYMISFGSSLLALFGLLLIYSFTAKLFSKKIAIISTITFWLSSSIFYYQNLEASLSHSISLFAVSAFIYYWYRSYKEGGYLFWFNLGLLSAFMIMVRYQNGFFMILPLIYSLAIYLKNFKKEKYSEMFDLFYKNLFYLFSIFIGLIPQFLVLKYQHGKYFSALNNYQTSLTYSAGFFTFIKVLFSTNHGLFLWTPVTLIGFVGLLFYFKNSLKSKKNPLMSLSFIILFVLQLAFISSMRDWNGAQSYGHRMFINCGLILIVGLAYVYDYLSKKYGDYVIYLISFVLIGWNFNLMLQYGARMIPTEGNVDFGVVLYNTFFVIPKRIVGILSKFLFNRGDML